MLNQLEIWNAYNWMRSIDGVPSIQTIFFFKRWILSLLCALCETNGDTLRSASHSLHPHGKSDERKMHPTWDLMFSISSFIVNSFKSYACHLCYGVLVVVQNESWMYFYVCIRTNRNHTCANVILCNQRVCLICSLPAWACMKWHSICVCVCRTYSVSFVWCWIFQIGLIGWCGYGYFVHRFPAFSSAAMR